MAENPTHSITLRLRRTTTHEAFVNVPVTGDLMQPGADAHGHRRLDAARVVEAALRLGRDPATNWAVEAEPLIEPHPIQKPPPEVGR